MSHPAFVDFLSAFSAVKSKVNGNPTSVGWMASQSPETERLVIELFFARRRLDVFLATTTTKGIPRVPRGFQESWSNFHESWSGEVEKVLQALIEKAIQNKRDVIEPDADRGELRPDRPSFDPLSDEPAALIEDILWLSDAVAGSWDDDLGDEQGKALEAWNWFRNTVGLNLSKVAQRWRDVQPIFIPQHVANAYGISELDSLHALLDQAVRAYVYGASGASIAMCRALTELVLEKHYGCKGKSLKAVIILAEKRFEWVRGYDLQSKRELGNHVLHRNRDAADDDVVGWLNALKSLIEKAPA